MDMETKETLALSFDQDLADRIRAEAKRLNQPLAWYVGNLLKDQVPPLPKKKTLIK